MFSLFVEYVFSEHLKDVSSKGRCDLATHSCSYFHICQLIDAQRRFIQTCTLFRAEFRGNENWEADMGRNCILLFDCASINVSSIVRFVRDPQNSCCWFLNHSNPRLIPFYVSTIGKYKRTIHIILLLRQKCKFHSQFL